SNMRGILARGVGAWLDHEADRDGHDKRPRLVDDWAAGRLDRNRTARSAEVVLQALVEHYDEYRDYNTTTTQSDYGENIHILLDFLRLKVKYDRFAWRMRPLALAHEVLCRRGQDALAAKWREVVASKTRRLAAELPVGPAAGGGPAAEPGGRRRQPGGRPRPGRRPRLRGTQAATPGVGPAAERVIRRTARRKPAEVPCTGRSAGLRRAVRQIIERHAG